MSTILRMLLMTHQVVDEFLWDFWGRLGWLTSNKTWSWCWYESRTTRIPEFL